MAKFRVNPTCAPVKVNWSEDYWWGDGERVPIEWH